MRGIGLNILETSTVALPTPQSLIDTHASFWGERLCSPGSTRILPGLHWRGSQAQAFKQPPMRTEVCRTTRTETLRPEDVLGSLRASESAMCKQERLSAWKKHPLQVACLSLLLGVAVRERQGSRPLAVLLVLVAENSLSLSPPNLKGAPAPKPSTC